MIYVTCVTGYGHFKACRAAHLAQVPAQLQAPLYLAGQCDTCRITNAKAYDPETRTCFMKRADSSL